MGQFNLPTGGTPTQQHNQSYGVGLGSADAIAASAGAAQPPSDELFPEQQGQHDETEELFGGLCLPMSNVHARRRQVLPVLCGSTLLSQSRCLPVQYCVAHDPNENSGMVNVKTVTL